MAELTQEEAETQLRALQVEKKILAYLVENPNITLAMGAYSHDDDDVGGCVACAIGVLVFALGGVPTSGPTQNRNEITARADGLITSKEADELEVGFEGKRYNWNHMEWDETGPFFALGMRLRAFCK